jgi:hypothetical protein
MLNETEIYHSPWLSYLNLGTPQAFPVPCECIWTGGPLGPDRCRDVFGTAVDGVKTACSCGGRQTPGLLPPLLCFNKGRSSQQAQSTRRWIIFAAFLLDNGPISPEDHPAVSRQGQLFMRAADSSQGPLQTKLNQMSILYADMTNLTSVIPPFHAAGGSRKGGNTKPWPCCPSRDLPAIRPFIVTREPPRLKGCLQLGNPRRQGHPGSMSRPHLTLFAPLPSPPRIRTCECEWLCSPFLLFRFGHLATFGGGDN